MEIEQAQQGGDDLYDVEAIINKRLVNNEVQYRVKWWNYPSKYNTWEPISNLQSVKYLIQIYEDQQKIKNEKKLFKQQKQNTKQQQKEQILKNNNNQEEDYEAEEQDQENFLQIGSEETEDAKVFKFKDNIKKKIKQNAEQINCGNISVEADDQLQETKITQIFVSSEPQLQSKNNYSTSMKEDNKQQNLKKVYNKKQQNILSRLEEEKEKTQFQLRLTGQQRNVQYNNQEDDDQTVFNNQNQKVENILELEYELTKQQQNHEPIKKLKYKRAEDLLQENYEAVMKYFDEQYFSKINLNYYQILQKTN